MTDPNADAINAMGIEPGRRSCRRCNGWTQGRYSCPGEDPGVPCDCECHDRLHDLDNDDDLEDE